MSRKVSMRLPDDLAALVDERVKSTGYTASEVMVDAMTRGLNWRLDVSVPPDTGLPTQMERETPTYTACGANTDDPAVKTALDDVATAAAKVLKQVDEPANCPSCHSTLVPWGAVKRCVKCQRNY